MKEWIIRSLYRCRLIFKVEVSVSYRMWKYSIGRDLPHCLLRRSLWTWLHIFSWQSVLHLHPSISYIWCISPTGPCLPGYWCKEGSSSPSPLDGPSGLLCPPGQYCPPGRHFVHSLQHSLWFHMSKRTNTHKKTRVLWPLCFELCTLNTRSGRAQWDLDAIRA